MWSILVGRSRVQGRRQMTNVLSKSRFDVHRAITDKIVQAIEAGAGKFVMPWHNVGLGIGRPLNVATGSRYRGVNVVALWAGAILSAFETGYWATYRQWQEVGAQVRKGERGSVIVFYKNLEPDLLTGEDGERRFVARASHVFNADQVDGWRPPEPVFRSPVEVLEEVEAFVRATGADIGHKGSAAFYLERGDYIQMPERTLFHGTATSTSTESYYSTLLHELTHWTGAKHRLNRTFGERFGDEAYAVEELVAELGAAFLCADLGISNDPRPDHAAYVSQWVKLLKNQPRAMIMAAQEASKASEFLHELVSPERP